MTRTARWAAALVVAFAITSPGPLRAQDAATNPPDKPAADAQAPASNAPADEKPAPKRPPAPGPLAPGPPAPATPGPSAAASSATKAGPADSTSARNGSKPVVLFHKRRSFRTSIDDYVEEVFRSHEDPCAKAAREGVPCFPTQIEMEGPRFSVADAMRRYRPEGGPAPGQVPTNAELQRQMSGAPLSASGGVSIDPVCTVKSLIRNISGGSNTFYLYRTWNGQEQRPLLTDHKLDPNTYLRVPGFRYEFIGEYKGECEAVAAWRAAERNPAPSPR